MNKYICILLGLFLMGMASCTQNDLPISEEQIQLEQVIENDIVSPNLQLDEMNSPEKIKLDESSLKADFVPTEPQVK